MSILENIDLDNTPDHVAIIMDGNGRWAKQQGENRLFGHNFGVESVREVLKGAQQANVKYLTLYAFSTENWSRPKEEVEGLMNLLVHTISNEVADLHKNNVCISTIGDLDGLPGDCRQEMLNAFEVTKNNTGVHLILALNYSSKWEMVQAIKSISEKVDKNEIDINDISEELVSSELSTSKIQIQNF